MLNYNPQIGKTLTKQFEDAQTLDELLDYVAINIPMHFLDRQRLLGAETIEERFMSLMTILQREVNILDIKTNIAKQIKERVDKNQREYVLREQLRVIKEELGEGSTATEEEKYREAALKLKAKKEIKPEDSKWKRFWKYFKHTAPVAAPVLITAAGTVVAFKEADKEKNRRFALVAAAYTSSLAEINTLKQKVEEVAGPFAYPLYISDGLEIKKRLAKKGIFIASLWPAAYKFGGLAKDFSENILPLPCDQRYTLKHMELMIDQLEIEIKQVK
jgi:hypothetical protein